MARIPDSIGKYKVVSEVARGGMGAVYKARHPTLDRDVIIKKLTLRGNAAIRERFRREASIMMDFRNEYIVDVLDHFREGATYYIVQEYVDGLSLSQLLYRERYLPERIALLIFQGCCRALEYAHDRKVIHRDIKPGNLLISREGEVKLVDFGVARMENGSEQLLTREGMTLGTPSYMAPEQFEDTRSVDRRADIYSAGVVLYEMVTGKRPYPGSITPETIRLIQHGRYRRPRKINPAISRFTERLIRRSMLPRRRRRFQDFGTVLDRVHRRLRTSDVASERAEIAAYLSGKWSPEGPRRRRAMLLGVLLPALLVIAGALYFGGRTGILPEYLQPGLYGRIELLVRLPRGARVQAGGGAPEAAAPAAAEQAAYVTADLSPEGDGPQVSGKESATPGPSGWFAQLGALFSPPPTGRNLSLAHAPTLSTQEIAVFRSGPVYLRSGRYRVEIRSPRQILFRDVYVPSRVESRSRPLGARIVLTLPEIPPRPLSVDVRISSALDGADLSFGSRVELAAGSHAAGDPAAGDPAAGSGFEAYPGPGTGPLYAGGSYRFRISRTGYYTVTYPVTAPPGSQHLQLDASVVPVAGEVALASNRAGLEIRLDGSHFYRSWGPRPIERELPATASHPVELSLAPGRYLLAVRSAGEVAEQHITVYSGRRLALSVRSGGAKGGTGALRIESEGYQEIQR